MALQATSAASVLPDVPRWSPGRACAAGYHERPQQWPRAGPVDAPVEHGVTAVVDGEPMHPSGVAAAESSTYAMCRRPAGAPLWIENHERIRLVIQ